MAKVECEIDLIEIENDDGYLQPAVQATCSRCGHTTESFGTEEKSTRRCLVLMREECPRNERNFYVDSEESE